MRLGGARVKNQKNVRNMTVAVGSQRATTLEIAAYCCAKFLFPLPLSSVSREHATPDGLDYGTDKTSIAKSLELEILLNIIFPIAMAVRNTVETIYRLYICPRGNLPYI